MLLEILKKTDRAALRIQLAPGFLKYYDMIESDIASLITDKVDTDPLFTLKKSSN